MSQPNSYSIVKKVATDYTDTIAAVRAAFAEQGFGILTEIDIAATLKKKIDVDYPRTIILGACNPPLAHRALNAVVDVAVLMPCNVVVRENENKGVEVAAMNPMVIDQIIDNPDINVLAKEVEQRIRKAMDKL